MITKHRRYGPGRLKLALCKELTAKPWQFLGDLASTIEGNPGSMCHALRTMVERNEAQQDQYGRYALCGPLPGQGPR